MSKYYVKLHIKDCKEIEKIKIDYSIFSVSETETGFKSNVSSQEFVGFKKNKKFLYKRTKSKNSVMFEFVFETDKKTEETEKEILPIIKKFIKPRVKFRFKKKIEERISRILR